MRFFDQYYDKRGKGNLSNLINKLERKFGKYAINNLTFYILVIYAIGFFLQFIPGSELLLFKLSLNPYLILHGEVWRLISWVLIPGTDFSIFIIITFFFYYFIGSTLERTIGAFRYNLFIFSGCILMILSAFAYYIGLLIAGYNDYAIQYVFYLGSLSFSTYYIQEMIFLLFAIIYPDVVVLFMMIIPIKVKYLGYFYAALLGYSFIYGIAKGMGLVSVVIGFQALNLLLFYKSTGRTTRFSPKAAIRRQNFQKQARMTPKGVTRHKCAVCGRTEEDAPDLEFRFCSKCNGNYEYCQDHLFTHQHVK